VQAVALAGKRVLIGQGVGDAHGVTLVGQLVVVFEGLEPPAL